jgi:hypothetical protein
MDDTSETKQQLTAKEAHFYRGLNDKELNQEEKDYQIKIEMIRLIRGTQLNLLLPGMRLNFSTTGDQRLGCAGHLTICLDLTCPSARSGVDLTRTSLGC